MARECADPGVHRARQEGLLKEILRAARRIPAYAHYARNAPERNRVEYLADSFPIIEKSTLLADHASYFPDGRPPRHRATIAATSGTTGTPLDVYRSIESILQEEAFHLQH